MGGTGVALARDGSAPFLNPATITRIQDGQLAFSVNLYSLSSITLDRWFQPGATDEARLGPLTPDGATSSRLNYRGIPSTVCLFLRSPEGDQLAPPAAVPEPLPTQLAVCLGYLQRNEFGHSDTITRRTGTTLLHQSQAVTHEWNRYAGGPTYARALGHGFTLGGSILGHLDIFRSAWSASALATPLAGGDALSSALINNAHGYSLALGGVIGLSYRTAPVTVGLSVSLPSLHLLGHLSADLFTQRTDGPRTSSAFTAAEGDFSTGAPLQIDLGIGHEIAGRTLEFDAGFAFAMSHAYESRLRGGQTVSAAGQVGESLFDQPLSRPSRAVIHLGAGVEQRLSSSTSLLGGIGTDLSALPPAELARERIVHFDADRTSRILGSFGVGSYGSGGELLIGVETAYGWGDRLAVNTLQGAPAFASTTQHEWTVTLILSGATSLHTLRRAFDGVTDLVKPIVPGLKPETPPP
jgi:hypothetical protein